MPIQRYRWDIYNKMNSKLMEYEINREFIVMTIIHSYHHVEELQKVDQV